MILVLCVDQKMGLSFGGKRQSRDGAVCERILADTAGKRLWIAPESECLFQGSEAFFVSENPAASAGEGEFVFLEKGPLPDKGVEAIVLYHWNRRYPATEKMTLELSAFRKEKTEKFAGSSHEKITREYWKKR